MSEWQGAGVGEMGGGREYRERCLECVCVWGGIEYCLESGVET